MIIFLKLGIRVFEVLEGGLGFQGGGGGYNFLRVLILGCQNTQDWPLFKSCQTIFMFPSKVDKKIRFGGSLSALY